MNHSMESKKLLKNIFVWFLLIALCASIVANAYASARVDHDPQIKLIDYHPNHVVTLVGTHFVATSVQFAKSEKIIGVYIGDQIAWTYAINSSIPYLLFLKPTLDISDTNMTVVTNQHIYHFHLLANENTESRNSAVYNLQFHYDYEAKKKVNNKSSAKSSSCKERGDGQSFVHTHYFLNGSASLFPQHVYDDGRFTYFEFSDQTAFPAVFVYENGHEKITNTQIKSNTLIAKCTAKVFLLVKNDEKVWVENKN